MSSIKLTSFVVYRRHKKSQKEGRDGVSADIVHGSTGYTIDPKSGNLLFQVDSVPLGLGLPPAVRNATSSGKLVGGSLFAGVLMLYGFRDTLDELQQRRQEARGLGAEFKYMDVELDVGEIVVGLIDRKLMRTCRFANVKRMTAALQSEILLRFSEYVQEEGGNVNEDMSRVKQIASRPDLWGRLIEEDSAFRKAEVLVIPVADDPKSPRVRQVALVRPKARILSVNQNMDNDVLVLPKGFGKYIQPGEGSGKPGESEAVAAAAAED